jgi:hypothetical protein
MAKPLPLPVWDRQRGKFVCEWMDDHKAHYESQPQRSLTQWIKSPVPAVRRRQGAGRLRWVRAGRLSVRECDAVEICDMAGMLHADQRVGWNRDQHLD